MTDSTIDHDRSWPPLPLAEWQDTYATLHMYTQVVGKVRLALAPRLNQWWETPLYLTARGLTTSAIPYQDLTFDMVFDFIDHRLIISTSTGQVRQIALGGSVKDFHRDVMNALQELGITVRIWSTPVEVLDPVPFEQQDRAGGYDPAQAHRFWHILARVAVVFEEFRARFTGKCSPVHFFWGSFDLAVTRFSGRPAPPPPGADPITQIGYNAELSSLGFWPGGAGPRGAVPGAAFYSYGFPEPPEYRFQPLKPAAATYDEGLGQFLLMYDEVRLAADPRQDILDFGQTTYEAIARLQKWPMDEFTMAAATG